MAIESSADQTITHSSSQPELRLAASLTTTFRRYLVAETLFRSSQRARELGLGPSGAPKIRFSDFNSPPLRLPETTEPSPDQT